MLQTEVQEIWLDVDGMRIHCLTAGESGSPVVLLHGAGLDSATLSWGDAITPLSAHHRVFAPDLPGYGLSDKPDIQYMTDFYVTFVNHLLDMLQLKKVSLVGLSMARSACARHAGGMSARRSRPQLYAAFPRPR